MTAAAVTADPAPVPPPVIESAGLSPAPQVGTTSILRVRIFATVDACDSRPAQVTVRTLTVTVRRPARTVLTSPTARRRSALTARAAQVVVTSGCPDATLVPTPANLDRVAAATLCALNGTASGPRPASRPW